MTSADAASFLAALKAAADGAAGMEADFRRETAQRIAALERERSFAFRRLNFMRKVVGAIAETESEQEALQRSAAALREELGWSSESEARSAVLERFAPVTRAVSRSLHSTSADESLATSMADALAAFERWYGESHAGAFWALFDQYRTETPLVDF